MSSLPRRLEDALRNIIPTIPAFINLPRTTKNFGDFAALSDTVQRQIYSGIATALLGNDQTATARALLDALRNDGTIRWVDILRAWASELAGSDPIKQDILKALADGTLSQEEIASILIKWVKNNIADPKIVAAIDGIATIYNVPGAQKALQDYLLHAGFPDPATATSILKSIADGQITPRQVLQVLAAWAAASGQEDFARILETPELQSSTATPEQKILAVIGQRLPSDVQDILKKLLDDDWSGLLAIVLGALVPGLGSKALADIESGNYRQLVIDRLAGLLKDAGVKEQQTVPLLDALIDLATGARSLFALPEDQTLDLSPTEIAIWQEIRSVIYIAQLACKKGDLVPTDAQAQPNIFIAANIRFTTPLHDLVPSNASTQVRDEFRATLTRFVDIYFGDRMNTRFQETNSSVVPDTALVPDAGQTCEDLFGIIYNKIRRKGANP